jgi:hypothetical protein
MTTSGYLTSQYLNNLTSPFNTEIAFNELTQSDLGKEVINKLWVNRDKSNPDFGRSEVTTWNVDTIPTTALSCQVYSKNYLTVDCISRLFLPRRR